MESLKADANSIKERLMNIVQELYQERAIKEAQILETIIAKLEVWQNQ